MPENLPINPEIQEALQQFEQKEEERRKANLLLEDQSTNNNLKNKSTMARFVMNHSGGLIKTEEKAKYVLLAFMVIMLATTFLILGLSAVERQEALQKWLEAHPDRVPRLKNL